MSIDLLVIETGDGGDIVIENNDIKTIEGLQNMIYLALFGGNYESSSKDITGTEQRFYWWGNDVFFDESPEQQMNSETERILNKIVINSQGRLRLLEAVKLDLKFLEILGTVTVNVIFETNDTVKIEIILEEPTNENGKKFTFIWSATRKELTEKNYYPTI